MSPIFAMHTDTHEQPCIGEKGELGEGRFWICFCHFPTFICHINGCKRRKIMSVWMDRVIAGVGAGPNKTEQPGHTESLLALIYRELSFLSANSRKSGKRNCCKSTRWLFVTKGKIDSSSRHSNKSNALFDVSFISGILRACSKSLVLGDTIIFISV